MSTSTKPFPFPTADSHPPMPPESQQSVELPVSEEALDQGVAESFPASDPVSVTVTKVVGDTEDDDKKKAGDAKKAGRAS